jgi:hypothetical protein
MKKFGIFFIFFIVFLVWLTPAITSAGEETAEKLRLLMENTTPEQRARFEDRWMQRDLHLSQEQAAKISKINLQTAERMQSIYNSNDRRFRKFRKIMTAREEKDNELRTVLTKDQLAKYQMKKDEMWEKMHRIK